MSGYFPLRITGGSRTNRDLVRSPREVTGDVKGVVENGNRISQLPKLGDENATTIVQWTEAITFAQEGTHAVTLTLMRIGDQSGTSSVAYYTKDRSAKAGEKYYAASGVVTFLPTEHTKYIEVKLMDDDVWGAAVEFLVVLSDPEGCMLGAHQHTCRVKYIDDDFFPDNSYQVAYRENRLEEISGLRLLVSYFKFNFLYVRGIFWRCCLQLSLDQLHNAYFIMTTYLNIYMVDVVFKGQDEDEGGEAHEERRLLRVGLQVLDFVRRLAAGSEHGGHDRDPEHGGDSDDEHKSPLFGGFLFNNSRHDTAIVCAWLYICPLFLLHVVDIVKVHLNVSGRSREYLQTSLFRKYLNYSELTQRNTTPVAISVGVITEAAELAEMGFMKAVAMARVATKTIIVVSFVHMEQPSTTLPIWFCTAITICWVGLWIRKLIANATRIVEEEKAVMQVVHHTASCYRLVADYYMRPHAAEIFDEKAQALTKAKNNQEFELLNTRYFFTWISTSAVGCYMITRADKVLQGSLSLGTFLAMIKIIFELGLEFVEIFDEVVELVRTIGPLRVMINFLNSETDFLSQLDENKRRQEAMQTWISKVTVSGHVDWDRVPITVQGLRFEYGKFRADEMSPSFNLRLDERLVVPQGSMVAVIGQHLAGKSTLLQLLGDVHEYQSGFVFVPPHLRILHVAQHAMLFPSSLFQNLTYGLPDHQTVSAKDTSRVRRLMQALGFDNYLMSTFEADLTGESCKSWRLKISSAQCALINFARALVANPNVLIVHRPTANLNKDNQLKVMMSLRQFVQNRGLEYDTPAETRRPRTCIYSSDRVKEHGFADQVWEVDAGVVKCVYPEASPQLPSLQNRH
eukprot:TRINITY_DN88042_c0_g1_i1.p1 TRINITY_DN88042_c0_g1~~TRINITY_DN88042_c0_g1_i1.p1  ORF type:complete len:853 (+),score=141.83 TRINITY_DN88042_c0_g1_i1:146-2704(+)